MLSLNVGTCLSGSRDLPRPRSCWRCVHQPPPQALYPSATSKRLPPIGKLGVKLCFASAPSSYESKPRQQDFGTLCRLGPRCPAPRELLTRAATARLKNDEAKTSAVSNTEPMRWKLRVYGAVIRALRWHRPRKRCSASAPYGCDRQLPTAPMTPLGMSLPLVRPSRRPKPAGRWAPPGLTTPSRGRLRGPPALNRL